MKNMPGTRLRNEGINERTGGWIDGKMDHESDIIQGENDLVTVVDLLWYFYCVVCVLCCFVWLSWCYSSVAGINCVSVVESSY